MEEERGLLQSWSPSNCQNPESEGLRQSQLTDIRFPACVHPNTQAWTPSHLALLQLSGESPQCGEWGRTPQTTLQPSTMNQVYTTQLFSSGSGSVLRRTASLSLPGLHGDQTPTEHKFKRAAEKNCTAVPSEENQHEHPAKPQRRPFSRRTRTFLD